MLLFVLLDKRIGSYFDIFVRECFLQHFRCGCSRWYRIAITCYRLFLQNSLGFLTFQFQHFIFLEMNKYENKIPLCMLCPMLDQAPPFPHPVFYFYILFFIFWPHAVGIWYKETIEIIIHFSCIEKERDSRNNRGRCSQVNVGLVRNVSMPAQPCLLLPMCQLPKVRCQS